MYPNQNQYLQNEKKRINVCFGKINITYLILSHWKKKKLNLIVTNFHNMRQRNLWQHDLGHSEPKDGDGAGRGQALRYIVLGNCHEGGGASIRQGHIIQT